MWEVLYLTLRSVSIPFVPYATPHPQATVLCDLLLLHILPKRHYYKQKKFKYAEDMRPEAVRELLELGPSETRGLCVCAGGGVGANSSFPGLTGIPSMHIQGEHDPATTSSTLGLQENMRTS